MSILTCNWILSRLFIAYVLTNGRNMCFPANTSTQAVHEIKIWQSKEHAPAEELRKKQLS